MMKQQLMFTYKKTARSAYFAFIFICFFTSPAYAFNEYIDLSQADNGEIVARLSGLRYHCSFGFGGTSVSTPNQVEFLVSTTVVPLSCPSNPNDPPSPYSLAVNLGSLPDGNYNITWAFLAFPGVPPQSSVASQSFVIRSGFLVGTAVSIPTLTEWGMISFALIAGLGSIYYLRKRTSQS